MGLIFFTITTAKAIRMTHSADMAMVGIGVTSTSTSVMTSINQGMVDMTVIGLAVLPPSHPHIDYALRASNFIKLPTRIGLEVQMHAVNAVMGEQYS